MIFLGFTSTKSRKLFKYPTILFTYFKYSIVPAIIASVPAIFFIKDDKFTQTWLLYLGDGIFLFSIITIMLIMSRKTHYEAATGSLLIAGHTITVFGIIVICLITFILLLFYVPDLFHLGNTKEVLKQAPANIVFDKTHGLLYILFVNAVIGTFAAGSFATLIMSYSTKRNQEGDKAEL